MRPTRWQVRVRVSVRARVRVRVRVRLGLVRAPRAGRQAQNIPYNLPSR